MDKLQVVYKRLDEIKPYENNPRLNDDAVEPVANSIKEFGFKVPIVVDKDGVIVAGHTRYKAAQKLGLQSVPCLVADDLSPEQIKAFRLADNKTGELALWDFNLLDDELKSIEDIDMEQFGFDEAYDLDDGDTDNDCHTETGGLKGKFIFTPSSVLDTRSGGWQKRKRAWLGIGLNSTASREGMKTTGSLSGTTPRYYQYKNEKERELGRKITNAEFEEKYLSAYLPKNSLIAKTDDGGILSVFDPVLCELIYTWFSFEGAEVIDPFAGGSVRGVVASMLGRKYTGVDLRQEQIEANEKQRNELLAEYQNQPRWICGDSMKIKELAPGEYDFVFSCPPYFDLEKYSEDENDLT